MRAENARAVFLRARNGGSAAGGSLARGAVPAVVADAHAGGSARCARVRVQLIGHARNNM